MSEPKQALSATVSLSQKINTGNYSSADVFLSLSNITVHTTPEEMDKMLDATNLAFSKIRERIKAEVQRIKSEGGV